MWRPNYWGDLVIPTGEGSEKEFERGANAMLRAVVGELRGYAREQCKDKECLVIHQALDRTIDEDRITEI